MRAKIVNTSHSDTKYRMIYFFLLKKRIFSSGIVLSKWHFLFRGVGEIAKTRGIK